MAKPKMTKLQFYFWDRNVLEKLPLKRFGHINDGRSIMVHDSWTHKWPKKAVTETVHVIQTPKWLNTERK